MLAGRVKFVDIYSNLSKFKPLAICRSSALQIDVPIITSININQCSQEIQIISSLNFIYILKIVSYNYIIRFI